MSSYDGIMRGGAVESLTETKTIHEEVPFVVEVAPQAPTISEERLEEWQAHIPDGYATLENPFVG
ncbi:MAG: hypothetical protein GY943_26040 [Chloroflexi bacterium]|nr:hypothetical protein [Chloroflexota bacterium]